MQGGSDGYEVIFILLQTGKESGSFRHTDLGGFQFQAFQQKSPMQVLGI